MKRPSERWLGILAAGAAIIFWAAAFVGIRAASKDFSPGSLSLARLVLGSTALGIIALLRHEKMIDRASIRNVVVVGVVWFGAYNLILNQAERTVDAGTAAMLVNIAPIIIAILSGLFLGEGFPRRLFIGCAIAFAGTCTIGFAISSHGLQAGAGALLCIASAFAAATGVTMEKPILRRNSALIVVWLACTIGAVICLPFAPLLMSEIVHAHPASIVWAVFLGLVPTAMGFTFWGYALARTNAGRLGVSGYLVPPLSILMGWVLLGELPPGLAFLGGALCVVGVGVASGLGLRRQKTPASPM